LSRLELAVPPPIVMAVALLLMWLSPSLDFQAPLVLGIGLIAAGLAIGIGAFLQFRRANTTVNPMTPDKTSALVTSGLFGLSRNPIYVADAIILAGAALLFANLLAFVALALFVLYVDRFQIRPEERALQARFGEAFEAYRREVRRWL
jgi:protein-S-isoprenylcysteine O-methyltransferase Ste14